MPVRCIPVGRALLIKEKGNIMEIKGSCIYDKNAIKALTDVQMFGKKNPKKQKTLIILFMILPVVFMLCMMALTGFEPELLKLLFFLIVFYGIIISFLLVTPRLAYRNSGKVAESVNEYTFTDTHLKAESTNEGLSSQSQIAYENIYRAIETSIYLFVYINSASAYIIEKSTIDGEGMQLIREKLRTVLGKRKYIICRY